MSRFDDYSECDKKMYADHARMCAKNGIHSHWDEHGTYQHWWNDHSKQKDREEKLERDHAVWMNWKQQKKTEWEKENYERNKQHNSPWKNEYEELERNYKIAANRRVDDEKRRRDDEKRRLDEEKRHKIAAAIEFLERNGIQTARK